MTKTKCSRLIDFVPVSCDGTYYNLEARACNPLRRLAEALGNTSESRALIGCFSSANYYSNFEPYLVIQISNIV
jgi:hypothetical protein